MNPSKMSRKARQPGSVAEYQPQQEGVSAAENQSNWQDYFLSICVTGGVTSGID